MRRFFIVLGFVAMGPLAGAAVATAEPLPDIVRELIEQAPDEGDHVVGEELCARPGAIVTPSAQFK
jgi:hypothetical protein